MRELSDLLLLCQVVDRLLSVLYGGILLWQVVRCHWSGEQCTEHCGDVCLALLYGLLRQIL